MSDLEPREAVAQRLLALRALQDALAVEVKKVRAEAGALFTKAGQREPATLPDGTSLGNVRADKGAAAGWKVVDEPAFRTWVEQTCPDAIGEEVVTTYVVDSEYQALVLSKLGKGLPWVEPATGEELDGPPPGVKFAPAGRPKLVVTGEKGAADAVRQFLAPVLLQLEVGA